MKKISCLCTTWGRHTIMNRLIAQFIAQDYPNKELIILNTAPIPLVRTEELIVRGDIILDNRGTFRKTGLPYTNRGDILTDALSLAHGDVFCLFDDDDIYLPWHISQGMTKLAECGKLGWKPKRSFFSKDGGQTFEWCENYLEATVFADINAIRRLGFRAHSGAEGLDWYHGLQNEGQLCIDPTGLPSYVFEWGQPLAPHKQSGDLSNPSNFENHKAGSTDFGGGVPLTGKWDMTEYHARIAAQFPELAAQWPAPSP